MSFTSLQFLLFLPLVFALYWAMRRRLCWQNVLLVVASYVFYGWWDWRFLGLIALTTAVSFVSGLLLEHFEGRERQRRIVTISSVLFNLGILVLFKYYNFFADNFTVLLQAFGLHADLPTLRLILPIGKIPERPDQSARRSRKDRHSHSTPFGMENSDSGESSPSPGGGSINRLWPSRMRGHREAVFR